MSRRESKTTTIRIGRDQFRRLLSLQKKPLWKRREPMVEIIERLLCMAENKSRREHTKNTP